MWMGAGVLFSICIQGPVLYGVELARVLVFNYLGLIFAHDASWLPHWKMIKRKALGISNFILKFGGVFQISIGFLCMMLRSILRAALFYGTPVWAPPVGGFRYCDALMIKPVMRSLALPWNCGAAGVQAKAAI